MIRNWWSALGALMLMGVYLASGIYLVRPDERGVVRRFGQVTRQAVPPGLHYALPWPVSRVDRPKTTEVRRVVVGLTPDQREAISRGNVRVIQAAIPNDLLTGDVNILKATLVVQYQVKDPVMYLFGTDEPHQLVHSAVQVVLVEILAGRSVDELLTVSKGQLQAQALSRAQAILDQFDCGVDLVATTLESIEPPRAVITAFVDVASARKDAERSIDRAVNDSNYMLSQARAEAVVTVEQSAAYRQTRTSAARGESSRFSSVLGEYRKYPGIFKRRLLLQTLESVLPQVRTYVLDHKEGDLPTTVKIIENE